MLVLCSLKFPFAIPPSDILPECEQCLNLTEDAAGCVRQTGNNLAPVSVVTENIHLFD